MPDLDMRIREYIDATSQPLTIDDVLGERIELTAGTATQRSRPWAVVIAAAAVVLVIVGVVPWLMRSPGVNEPTAPSPSTSVSTPEAPNIPAPASEVSGEWVSFDVAEGLPGTPIDTIAVDASGGVWVLAHTDDPTTAQLYSFDAGTRVFVARGAPLQLTAEWHTLWMEITSVGVVVSLGESEESGRPPERLLQWDDAGWHELSMEHSLPNLDMSIAQSSPDGGLRVAGYTPELGPVAIDITSDGVTYSVAPEGAWSGGGPSVFTVRHAVLPMGPDGRSWFSDGESSAAALGMDGYDVYDADTASDCCYVPLAADESGVWAYFESNLYRYDSDGWRAEVSIPLSSHDAEVAAITSTADGDIWVLGRNGVARIDSAVSDGTSEDDWTVYSDSEAQATGLPRINFHSTVMSEGDAVWIASWGGSSGFSVWLHNGHEWAQVDIPDSIDQEATGFRQNTVAATSSGIWVATSTGVARFDTSLTGPR
jgi:hypothetical protein